MAVYHNLRAHNADTRVSSSIDELRDFIARAGDEVERLTDAASVEFLGVAIGRKIFGFLLRPEEDVALGQTREQIGLDSLTAIELRRWWRLTFGVEITVLEILAAGTLGQSGRVAAEMLAKKAKARLSDG